MMFRRKIYSSLEDIQQDIDKWLAFYNRERPHSGRYCYGKTPWDASANDSRVVLTPLPLLWSNQ